MEQAKNKEQMLMELQFVVLQQNVILVSPLSCLCKTHKIYLGFHWSNIFLRFAHFKKSLEFTVDFEPTKGVVNDMKISAYVRAC